MRRSPSADGARGARDAWRDPADHLVAGFVARLADGSELIVRPAPRRSVGPDLFALALGMRGRFMTIVRAWLRVHDLGAAEAETAAFVSPRDPSMTEGEARFVERIASALGGGVVAFTSASPDSPAPRPRGGSSRPP